MHYRDDIPFMPTGLGVDQVWFGGGRIGVSLARHGGLSALTYYGRQPIDRSRLFQGDGVSAWSKLFRLCLVVDGVPYHPTFSRTRLYAFGYRSTCSLGGVAIRHELVLLNDALVQRVEVLRNPRRATLALRLVWHGQAACVGLVHRTWSPFAVAAGSEVVVGSAREDIPAAVYAARAQAKAGALTQCASFGTHDATQAETFVAVAADRRTAFQDLHHGFKYHADTTPFTTQAAFLVVCGWDRQALGARVAGLRRSVHRACAARFAAAADLPRRQPSFTLGRPALESFLANLPAVVDALCLEDVPGAMRASASHYWVWGWDSMVYSKGLMLAGRGAFVARMLEFYRRLAHPTLGIPHCLTADFTPTMAMASTAQTLYAVMLYNHYCVSRDLAVLREFFPFARLIVERALAGEVRGSGLVDGPSLFPDHPELVGHDGHDLSVFNNSIFYQALLALRDLAQVLGATDPAMAPLVATLSAAAGRCRAGFAATFFDAKAGYFIDSASSVDGSPRRHHPSYAILWVTGYAHDLVADELPRIAEFMARNLAAPRGVFHYPRADQAAFLSDGNQGSAGYPVIEPFYWNVMSLAGRGRELARWADNVAWFWDTHTIPEGLTYDAVNAGELTADCPGGKQPFAGKAWYELFFTAYAGIEVDIAGLVLRPTPVTGPVRIRNLVLAGRRLDLRIHGAGSTGLRATLNRKRLGAVTRIPIGALRRGTNRLDLART